MNRYYVRSLTEGKGQPRVYLDISGIEEQGFAPGANYKRTVNIEKARITLTVDPEGPYLVSSKERSGRKIPVIDINSAAALKPFEGMKALRVVVEENSITILPMASEANRKSRLDRLAHNMGEGEITTASLSFGGGVLDNAAHAGLTQAGVNARLAMANEIDEGFMEQALHHNDVLRRDTITIAAPMQELVQDHAAMSRLPKVDMLVAGLPCSGASQAGASKRKLEHMERHPEVGHLAASFLMVINRIQPATIVLENVVNYSATGSADIIRNHLRDSGYDVHETTLNAADFGCLEARERWFLVAVTRGIQLDLSNLTPIMKPVRRIADVLEPIGPEADDWRTFDYLKTKEVRDAAKGNSFAMQVITPESTSCPVLRRGYAKGGSTDPLLAHPTNPDLLRQLTVTEHARIKEVPSSLVQGMSKTDGHALLGQSVAYTPVKALFARIGAALLDWADQGRGAQDTQALNYRLNLATG